MDGSSSRFISLGPGAAIAINDVHTLPGREGGCAIQIDYSARSKPQANAGAEACRASAVTLPAVFVRDSCSCPECRSTSTLQRTCDGIDPGIAAEECSWDAAGGGGGGPRARILWRGDGHVTELSAEVLARWIRQSWSRGMPGEKGPPSPAPDPHSPVAWGREWAAALLEEYTFDFESVLERGEQTRRWAAALKRFGLTRLRGARHARGELHRLSRAVGLPLRATIYNEEGESTFSVKFKPGAVNQAYTAGELPLHTDLPFYTRPPDVQALHCVSAGPASDGGASTFADGLLAARSLAAGDRELLAGRQVTFEDVDPASPPRYHLEARHPVIQDRGEGNVSIHLNNGVRGAALPDAGGRRFCPGGAGEPEAALEDVRGHFAATARLRAALDAGRVEVRAAPGDIWVFDNSRVLHGRTAFAPSSPRELEGGYFAWDDIDSLLRLLGE